MATLTRFETGFSNKFLHSIESMISTTPLAVKTVIQIVYTPVMIVGVSSLFKKNYLNSSILALTQSLF